MVPKSGGMIIVDEVVYCKVKNGKRISLVMHNKFHKVMAFRLHAVFRIEESTSNH